jgi:hypothetical protein
MTKQEIFSAAHKIAKSIRLNFASYKAAFSNALKQVYSRKAVTIIKDGYDKTGMSYKQYSFMLDLGVKFTGFRSTTKAMQSMSVYDASNIIDRAKRGEKFEIIF